MINNAKDIFEKIYQNAMEQTMWRFSLKCFTKEKNQEYLQGQIFVLLTLLYQLKDESIKLSKNFKTIEQELFSLAWKQEE